MDEVSEKSYYLNQINLNTAKKVVRKRINVVRKYYFCSMKTELERLIDRYNELGINRQLDYDKFYLFSIITHSTAIDRSTITEPENQIMSHPVNDSEPV